MKRLSALAQLVSLYAEKGITKTSELTERTGYSDRAIRKAKAELGCRPAPECRHPSAENGTGVPLHAEPECRSESPPPPKRKVSPCTPSKENTPPPCAAAESLLAGEVPAGQEAAADEFEKCRPIITALVRALYPPTNFPFPPKAGVEKFIRAALDTGHTLGQIREAANILIAKAIDDEDEIRKPGVLFSRILGDVRREGVRGRKPIPAGAIDLGGGQFLSRW